MAQIDVYLSSAIYCVVIPGLCMYLLIRYIFGFTKAKFEAFMVNFACSWVHRKFCNREKVLLFQHLQDLRKKSQTHLNLLEIGAGSGMNFAFYPKGTFVTCLDPNPNHEAYLNANLERSGNNVTIVDFVKGYAENMSSIESDTFDAVVCTFTMCSVRDPAAVLSEVKRVLKPGGTFFFLEHVAGQRGSCIRHVQNVIQYTWPYLSSGCNLNRETWISLDQSGFSNVQYRLYSIDSWMFFFIRPCMYGTAVK